MFCMIGVATPVYAATEAPLPEKSAEVPFRADSGLITAEYFIATGKFMQAIDVLGHVISRHPRNADAYAYRGYIFMQLGDLEKAQINLQKAITIDPAHLGALKYMGDYYLVKGDQTRAIEQLQAMKAVCGITDCAEIAELQGQINRSKMAVPKEKAEED